MTPSKREISLEEQEMRKQRGLKLSLKGGIICKDDYWLVASETKPGVKYAVRMDGNQSCTCLSYLGDQQPCKHIHAVKAYIQRNTSRNGKVPAGFEIAINVKKPRKKRDWSNINQAERVEKCYFPILLRDLCLTIQEEANQKPSRGRPRLPLRDRVFAIVYKAYLKDGGRSFVSDLDIAVEKGYADTMMSFNTLYNTLGTESLTPILQELVTISSTPFIGIETDFAIDSTGFTSTRYASWFSIKHGRQVNSHQWHKLHLVCGLKTQVVAAVLVTDHTKSDSKQLPNLLAKLKEHFKVDNVLADMGYLSNDNIKTIIEAGAAAYIPFKRNATGKGSAKGGEMYNQQYHRFLADPETYMGRYHERSKIEAIFGAIKQKYGEKLWSKTEVAQQNEILCKVLAHNINTLNLDMQRNSSTPAFSGQIAVTPQPAKCEVYEGRRFYKARGKYAAPGLRAVIAQ